MPLAGRAIHHRLPVGEQAIEEEQRQRQLGAQRRDVELAAEAPHGDLERMRPALGADGCLAVPGGTENERLTPLDLSPHPDLPSRALFTDDQIATDLDRLEAGQEEDGGWTVDYLQWSPAQALEWRGIATILALGVLRENGRLAS